MHTRFEFMYGSHTSIFVQYHVPSYDGSSSQQFCVIDWYKFEPAKHSALLCVAPSAGERRQQARKSARKAIFAISLDRIR
jgi:hypothetical protein